MSESGLRYVSDEHGEPTAVIVPISLWIEMQAELETHHLLKSDVMKRRLLEARARGGGLTLDEVTSRLGLSEDAAG